jgi:hypothetical protein
LDHIASVVPPLQHHAKEMQALKAQLQAAKAKAATDERERRKEKFKWCVCVCVWQGRQFACIHSSQSSVYLLRLPNNVVITAKLSLVLYR